MCRKDWGWAGGDSKVGWPLRKLSRWSRYEVVKVHCYVGQVLLSGHQERSKHAKVIFKIEEMPV